MTADTDRPVGAGSGMGALDTRLAGLVETLAQARRRSNLLAFLNGLLTSIVIGLGLFVLLELLHGLLGGLSPVLSFEWLSVPSWLSEWGPSPVPQHIVVGLAGALAAFLVAMITNNARRTGIGRMARTADREFASMERFSTALEVARSRSSIGVVGEALMRDVAQRASSVNAGRLAPMRLGWQALLVPVLAVVAVLIANSPPAPLFADAFDGRTTPVIGGGPENFADAERLDAAGEIRAIAAILAQDGQARADPTLQAVANELNALGNELAANPNLDRATVGDALERLADAAQDAYAAAGVGAGENANYAQLVDDAIRAIDPGRYEVNNDAGTGPEAAAQEGVFDAGNVAGANVPVEGALQLPEGPELVADAVTVVEGANVPRELQHDWGDNPYDEDGAPEDFAVNPEVEIIGLGEGVGGNLAGLGAAELGGVPGARIVPGATEGELLLIDPNPGNGRMIQLNLPPLAELLPVDTEGLEAGGLWQPFQEAEVERTAIPAADLEAVARYFQTITAERTE